jgi:serine protease Do
MTVLIVVVVNLILYQLFWQHSTESEQVTESVYTRVADRGEVEEVVTTYPVQRERQSSNDDYQLTRSNAVTRAVMLTEPAVVSVNVIKTQIVRRYTNPFDNPFFGFFDQRPYRREVQSIGSGIIYNSDGYIVTNSHVVEGATQIKVILEDKRQFEAEIMGIDSVLDIAVLKIETDNLPTVPFGTSDDLLLGETVIAIGNPYAFLIKDSKPSVSVGVVSATQRNFSQDTGGKIYQGMIQTDAAINPGNSGGPLVNILGEVIGINTFIFSESGGNIGLGFAIPINRIIRVTDEIIEYGRKRQIWFGFKIQDLSPMIASYLELEDLNGVIVSIIEDNSPAAEAGLRRGDIIKKINNIMIRNSTDAEIAISEITVGDRIEMEIYRGQRTFSIEFDAIELDI